MADERSYTLDEIERETGFDKRTIAYYVQENLLPRVGRRGPRTRYPQSYLDRLLFIKMIREQQDQGKLGSVTLSDIKEVLVEMSEEQISEVVAGKAQLDLAPSVETDQIERSAIASPSRRRESMYRAGPFAARMDASPPPRTLRLTLDEDDLEPMLSPDDDAYDLVLDLDTGPPQLELREVEEDFPTVHLESSAPRSAPPPRQATIGKLLRRLARAAGHAHRGGRRSHEHWTRAEIMPDIALTARDLDQEQVHLLELAAQLLRREILRSRNEDD